MSSDQQIKGSSPAAASGGSGGNAKPQRKSKGGNSSEKVPNNVLQQLKTVERVFRWPVIDSTWKQGVVVYTKIKGIYSYLLYFSS